MEDPDLLPQRQPAKRRDLTPMSIEDLHLYIGELEEEIARARVEIDAKKRQRGGAEALFKR